MAHWIKGSNYHRYLLLVKSVPSVAKSINFLQACIYKSVKTGTFLKSLIAPRIVKFNILMPVFKGIPRIVTPEKTGKSLNGFPRDVILSLIEV